jgi:hypothetical protein
MPTPGKYRAGHPAIQGGKKSQLAFLKRKRGDAAPQADAAIHVNAIDGRWINPQRI